MIWLYITLAYLVVSSLIYWVWIFEPEHGYLEWPVACLVAFPTAVLSFGYFFVFKNTRKVVMGLLVVMILCFAAAIYAWAEGHILGWGDFFTYWARGVLLLFALPGYLIMLGFFVVTFFRLIGTVTDNTFRNGDIGGATGGLLGGLLKFFIIGFVIQAVFGWWKKKE